MAFNFKAYGGCVHVNIKKSFNFFFESLTFTNLQIYKCKKVIQFF